MCKKKMQLFKAKCLPRQVESAQNVRKEITYDTRKNVLQYDDVMREQRRSYLCANDKK